MTAFNYTEASSAEIEARMADIRAQLDAHRNWLQTGPQITRDLESELILAEKVYLPEAVAREAQ